MELVTSIGETKKSPYQKQAKDLLRGETFKHPLRSREGAYCTVLGSVVILGSGMTSVPVVARGGTEPDEVCAMVFADSEYVTIVEKMKRVEIALYPS